MQGQARYEAEVGESGGERGPDLFLRTEILCRCGIRALPRARDLFQPRNLLVRFLDPLA